MDKFKNLFTDEEIIEEDDSEPIEIKEVKKEEEVQKLPTFMREKIEKEQQEEKLKKPGIEFKKSLDLESNTDDEGVAISKVEDNNSFKFPISFSESDFVETRSRQSIHQRKIEGAKQRESEAVQEVPRREKVVVTESKVADLYKDKKIEKKKEQERRFRATPIISPIYGILDKNYTPVDMENTEGQNFEEKRHSKSVDFDSVRKKAYGSLSEEIKENLMCENCEYLKEAKECQKERAKKQHDELLYDVLEDETEEVEKRDITLDEATENYYDYGVAYEKQANNEYEEEYKAEPVLNDDVKIVNHEEDRPKKEIPPVKSSINLLSTLKKSMGDNVEDQPVKKEEKNLELTDDLFNLIDSMYDERNDG